MTLDIGTLCARIDRLEERIRRLEEKINAPSGLTGNPFPCSKGTVA